MQQFTSGVAPLNWRVVSMIVYRLFKMKIAAAVAVVVLGGFDYCCSFAVTFLQR